jgi:hypothetical protein
MIEVQFEVEQELEPFKWESIKYSLFGDKVLYLSGKLSLTDEKLIESFKNYDLVIIHEPYNYIHQLGERYESDLSSIAPSEKLYNAQLRHILSFSNEKKRVGLHIRNGDYKEWSDGQYFYSEHYWLEAALKFLNEDYQVWIFSNDLSVLLKEKLIEVGAIISCENFEVDFVRLMLMNEIVAPPSTFSSMAYQISSKFYNNEIKLRHLKPNV